MIWLSFCQISVCPHNYLDSTKTEYPFDNFLEDSKLDELIKVLNSHCQKKNALNNMAERNIHMHSLISQCVWETKSLHIIFSYVFTSLYNDMICGKTLSHWFFKKSNYIYRGFPPILDNIKT